ncbi:MAG: tRNA (N(6)-L-threonylcarbamoyladenosine(37)-C(2))-methylthiotransferase MtaB [Aggregatilineales bacterium]
MKVYLETLGCRLNESESEAMARRFSASGHAIVADAADADLCVINTCAVTQDATRASRQRIRQLNRAQPDARIVVTGCYAQLSPGEVGSLPGVDQVIGNLDKDQLVPIVLREPMDAEPIALDYVPGILGHTRAFVKVQDGCDNRCTFCVTRIARGTGRSRPITEVVAEIQAMSQAGYKEAILTGVQLGSYGERAGGLQDLIRAILTDTDIPRVRLSSLEPWDLDESFFALWHNPRLCPHLHLPLQSGCDATLKRMVRRTSQAEYRELSKMARATIPNLALSTDIIVGFPGETEAEFAESAAFIAEMDFMKLHVFPYSPRPGTAAARMRASVDPKVSKARVEHLRALSDSCERSYRQFWRGQTANVLWESVVGATEQGWINTGLTGYYVRVHWTGPRVLTNTITTVRLGDLMRDGLSAAGVEIQ